MELEQRVKALEQEVEILKNQIQATLLDIQQHLLTNSYPSLRAEDSAAETQSSTPAPAARPQQIIESNGNHTSYEPPVVRKMPADTARIQPNGIAVPHRAPNLPVIADAGDDEEEVYEAPVVRRVSLNASRAGSEETAPQHRPDYADEDDEDESPAPPVRKAAPRERPARRLSTSANGRGNPVQKPREEPPVHKAAAVDNQQTRPNVNASERQRLTAAAQAQPVQQPVAQNIATPSRAQTAPLKEQKRETEPADSSKKLVLKLIAGVQNAGAGIGWRKRNG